MASNKEIDFKIGGSRALVTGAGKGIGRAIAKRLVEAGAEVYALSRSQADLDSLKAECPGIYTYGVDLADWDATRKIVTSCLPINMLVNNAGTGCLESFLDTTPDSFDRVMNVNVKAVLNVSQIVARNMIERKYPGRIVNISSQASQRALPDHTTYCTSKAALDQMTRCMALELGPHQIRVNCVNPTVVLTELGRKAWTDPVRAGPMLSRIPQAKFAEIEDIVDPVLFLLSEQSAMINGATLPIDGGFWAC